MKDYESRLLDVTQSLAEFKSRALNAELQLEESSTNNTRVQELEKEVKEKGILIGKLRQEGAYVCLVLVFHVCGASRHLKSTPIPFPPIPPLVERRQNLADVLRL